MFRIQMLVILILLVFVIPTVAQDNSSTPYDIALEMIAEAAATNAVELDFQYLELTALPPEIGQLDHLERLYIEYGDTLNTLPPEIGQLTNLTELWLSWQNITTLPAEIGNLVKLEVLVLTQNQLTELPPEIGRLSRLRGLAVSQNQLSDLPPEIGQLSNLEFLDIGFNNFRQLPPEIGQLDNLKQLMATSNQLSTLPSEITNLTNLEVLDLGINQFTHLSNVFLELEIDDTQTQTVFRYTRNGWGMRTGINLQYNPLISPPPEIANQGLAAIKTYLRNQQRLQMQQILLWVASGVILCVGFVLAFRLKTRGGRKPKKKRG